MDKTIREHDAIVLLHDLADSPFVAGDSGVVVHIYSNAEAFEVEFSNPAGSPRFLVLTVPADSALKLQPRGAVAAGR